MKRSQFKEKLGNILHYHKGSEEFESISSDLMELIDLYGLKPCKKDLVLLRTTYGWEKEEDKNEM